MCLLRGIRAGGILGILLAAAIGLYQFFSSFDGWVILPVRGGSERYAVQTATARYGLLTIAASVSAAELPVDQKESARRVLDIGVRYDVAPLGAALRITDCSVREGLPDEEIIEFDRGGKISRASVIPGNRFQWDDVCVTILSAGAWAGLIRDGSGKPMLSLAVREKEEDEWRQGLFLDADRPPLLLPECGMDFHWLSDQKQAQGDFPEQIQPLDQARWGILEGHRIHWLGVVTPGSGITAADAAEYTVASVIPDPETKVPILQVTVRKGEHVEDVCVPANTTDPKKSIRFECATAKGRFCAWRAWRDGQVFVRTYHRGAPEGDYREIQEGGAISIGATLQVRVEQVMAQGLPIGEKGAPVRVATIRVGGEELALREGLLVRHGDATMRYRRLPRPALVTYRLSMEKEGSPVVGDRTLNPDEEIQLDGWRFSQHRENIHNQEVAILQARRVQNRLLPWGVVSIAVLLLTACEWKRRRVCPKL